MLTPGLPVGYRILITGLFSSLCSPALGQVNTTVHERCLKATDYKGCVEVFAGIIKSNAPPETQNIKLNIDTQVVADGNECPSEFAYAGGGYCRRVICIYGGLFGMGHHPDLAGKGLKCQKGIGQMTWGEWDKERVRASINPRCPQIPLEVGYQTTCHMSSLESFTELASENYAKAIDSLQNSYELNKRDWVSANNFGVALIELGRSSEAVEPLRSAISRMKHPKIKMNLAIAIYLSGSGSREAIELAKESLEEEPRFTQESYQKSEHFGPTSRNAIRSLFSTQDLKEAVNKAIKTGK